MFASAHRLTRGEPGGYNYSAISNNQGTGTENKETKQSLKPSVSHTFQSWPEQVISSRFKGW